ncbi:hypothetical protein GF337_06825 [candidate division KSB1 bacterium]|nr:hypothetical protein [candidate division KSB1 bacterium]
MIKLVRKLLNINEGEGLKVLLMFSYIFLAIASLLIVKPVRNSLFLSYFGVEKLPYAFIIVAVVAAVFTNFYSRYAKKIRLNILILYTTLSSIIILIVFWLLLYININKGWFYYIIYVWVALFGVITTSQFWLLANYVFNARQAKRLFGLIGAGAISGGIFGGYLTKFLAPVVGTNNLFFFCVVFLLICIVIMRKVWKQGARKTYTERIHQEKRIRRKLTSEKPFELLQKSQHLTYIAAIVGIGVIVANLVDYQFSAIASSIITDKDKLTAFFGFWLSNLSVASLLIQLLLTGRSLKIFGVTTSLFFLPFGILIGALSIIFDPRLWSAVFIKVCDGSFKQSIHKAGLELLALPLPTTLKNQGKAFIDVFIDSLATGIGGILLIIFTQQLGFSVRQISFVLIVFIVIWFYLIKAVKEEYINSFRTAIEKRSIDLQDQYINIQEASVLDNILKLLEGNNERQILYILQLVEDVKNERLIPYFKKLINHPSHEIKIQILRMIRNDEQKDFMKEVRELIHDPNLYVKVEAIRFIYSTSIDGKLELEKLLVDENINIRSAALLAATYEHRENREFRKTFPIKNLFDQFVDKFSETSYELKDIVFMKVILAKVIGISKVEKLYPFLKNLLLDDSIDVVREATMNAGSTRHKMFIPILMQYLIAHEIRKYARNALAEYENDAIAPLKNILENENEDYQLRLAIPKVLALIGTQQSVNLLLDNLAQEDLTLRFQILRALNRLRTNFPYLKFGENRIRNSILRETKIFGKICFYLSNKDLFEIYKNKNIQDTERAKKAVDLLFSLLNERLDNTLSRIFRLLGLKYSPADMYNAYRAITSNKPDLRANAVEFLENILDPNLKRIIIPITEYSTNTYSAEENRLKQKNGIFVELLKENDTWLKVCTIFCIAETNLKDYESEIRKLMRDQDTTVKETAEYALKRLKNRS